MKANRKSATAALRLWGACQAARYWEGVRPEKIVDARVIEALRAEPSDAKSDAGKEAFHKLSVGQIVKGESKTGRLPVICGVAVEHRAAIAKSARQAIREGFDAGPRMAQPYAGAASYSEEARDAFLAVDLALEGIYRELAFWVYCGGLPVYRFEHPELVVARSPERAKYRLHDETVELVVRALHVDGQTIVEQWAGELFDRLQKWQGQDPVAMIGFMLLELDQMEAKRVGQRAS